MNFEKLRESGRKIKMPEDMKIRIKNRCNESETPKICERRHQRLDGKLIAVCACCFLLMLGIGLKYSGAFKQKLPTASTTLTVTQIAEETVISLIESTENTVKQVTETATRIINIVESTGIPVTEKESESATTQAFFIDTNSAEESEESEYYYPDSGDVQYVQPISLDMVDLKRLRDAKAVAETMSEEEFSIYTDFDFSCFSSGEEYLKFCESELYIPVASDVNAETYWRSYTPDYGVIDICYNFDDVDKFRFHIETSESNYVGFENSNQYRYVETIQQENLTVEIYNLKWIYKREKGWTGFGVDIFIDGQRIKLFTNKEMTLDEFKTYFAMIEFVKIKDWI